MFGGLSFNKKFLVGINIAYVMVSFILIGVAAYGMNSSEITSLPIVGGIIACGVFLLMVAVLGIIATFKQQQALLFYYIIILSIIFILQFSIACACVAVDKEREERLSKKAWDLADSHDSTRDVIHDAEKVFGCCGYDKYDPRLNPSNYSTPPWSDERNWCTESIASCTNTTTTAATTTAATTTATPTTPNNTTTANTTSTSTTTNTTPVPTTAYSPMSLGCRTCKEKLDDKIEIAFNASGGLGLFFALTEFVAIFVAYVYRKQIANINTIA